jgi:hypothetical protein
MNEPQDLKVQTYILHQADQETVDELNKLLRQMHKKTRILSITDLADHMRRSAVAIMRNVSDNGRIIGIAVLVPNYCLSHVDGQIRNVVVDKRFIDHHEFITKGLVQTLCQYALAGNFDTLQAHVHTSRDQLSKIFTELGFEARSVETFRLKVSKARKLGTFNQV